MTNWLANIQKFGDSKICIYLFFYRPISQKSEITTWCVKLALLRVCGYYISMLFSQTSLLTFSVLYFSKLLLYKEINLYLFVAYGLLAGGFNSPAVVSQKYVLIFMLFNSSKDFDSRNGSC